MFTAHLRENTRVNGFNNVLSTRCVVQHASSELMSVPEAR